MIKKILYVMGMLFISVSIVVMVRMQSEYTYNYFAKFMAGVLGVACVSYAMLRALQLYIKRHARKGPVTIFNALEDDKLLQEVAQDLSRQGYRSYLADFTSTLGELKYDIEISEITVFIWSGTEEDCWRVRDIVYPFYKDKKEIIAFSLTKSGTSLLHLKHVRSLYAGESEQTKRIVKTLLNRFGK